MTKIENRPEFNFLMKKEHTPKIIKEGLDGIYRQIFSANSIMNKRTKLFVMDQEPLKDDARSG